jgi:hypothetical protein
MPDNQPITIPELLADIRERGVPDFMLASTVESLIARLEANTSVVALMKHYQAGYADEICTRAWHILHSTQPEGVAHPDDLELAALLWIIEHKSGRRGGVSLAFSMACFNLPDWFPWASRVMRKTPDYEKRAEKMARWKAESEHW